jgi:hypothetical protein
MSELAVSDIVPVNISVEGRVKPLVAAQQDFGLSAHKGQLEAFGFKLTEGGAHISRTLMLKEINRVLASSVPEANSEDYQRAVINENVLGKATETTRQKTFRHLRELYALSPKVPIFSIYRDLMKFDPQSGPLLFISVLHLNGHF